MDRCRPRGHNSQCKKKPHNTRLGAFENKICGEHFSPPSREDVASYEAPATASSQPSVLKKGQQKA